VIFYASSGVELADVAYDPDARLLDVRVKAEPGAHYTVQFIGSTTAALAADGSLVPGEVGVVFAIVDGPRATYRLTGRELYVRAVVTSDLAPAVPSFEDQKQQAWTQPVAWEWALKR